MKKWITIALVLFLSACSSSVHKSYYQLPILQSNTSVQSVPLTHHLWLQPIVLADYLNNGGLVYQTNDVEYVVARNNIWASPLEQQLQQTLINNLSHDLPGWLVSAQQQGNNGDSLQVIVNGFHGRYDGRVIIRGEWVLHQQGRFTRQPFNIELKQSKDGYDSLVRLLAQGWQEEAAAIAKQITGSMDLSPTASQGDK